LNLTTRELIGIQYLRGLAALLVVFEHANIVIGLPKYFSRQPVPFEFYGGPAGVDLFFVISGFIIAYITLHPSSLWPRVEIGDFLWRRFARIIPFLWICVAIYAALRFLGRDGSFELAPYLRAFTLFPIGPLNPTQAWTLRHEFLFYLMFASVFWLPRLRFIPLALWMLSPLIFFAIVNPSEPTTAAELLGFLFNRLNLLFGFGFAVSLVYLKRPQWFAPSIPSGMVVCIVLSVLYLALFMVISYVHLSIADVLIAGLGGSAILYVGLRVRSEPVPGIVDRIGHALGDASYAIYLSHGIFISGVVGFWSRRYPEASVVPVLLVCVIGALVFGFLTHRYIELPVVRVFQKRRPTVKPQPTALPVENTPSSL
jgi:exopolysaccharide production protein ExoZ